MIFFIFIKNLENFIILLMHQQTPTPTQTKTTRNKKQEKASSSHYLNPYIFIIITIPTSSEATVFRTKTWGSRRRWHGEPDCKRGGILCALRVHQLVQAGLLGNDKNIEMFPFATLEVGAVENALGKPTRMAINDQSLKDN